jgi:mono/diheme cytochrome c family protein
MASRFVVYILVFVAALTVAKMAAAETPLERGRYLMNSIVACGNCHTPQGPTGPIPGKELAGGLLLDDEAFTVRVPNITPDRETGIGAWTDEQIIAAIREGKRPDGSMVRPPMPVGLYRQMSDEDARAIVAYMRSVPPVKNKVDADATYRMPLPPSWGPPVGSVPSVAKTDKVAYGAYMAGPLGHCIECHTPMGETGFDFKNRLGAGGITFRGPWGVSASRNITSDRESGLGAWSDSEIKRAITQGISRDGGKLHPPMAYGFYANIGDDDMSALIAYLRTIPPVR